MSALETAARFFIEVTIASTAAGAPSPCIASATAPDRCLIYTGTSKVLPLPDCIAIYEEEAAFWKAFLEGNRGNDDLTKVRVWIKCDPAF